MLSHWEINDPEMKTHPAQNKGQILKDELELLFHAPDHFDQSPLCSARTLQCLLGERYQRMAGDGLQPGDLAVEGLKQLAARLCAEALQQDDVHLAEGLVLIWHQYLEPIHSGSARSIPAVARVLAYCAQPGNLREFWHEVNRLEGDAQYAGSSQANGLFGDVSVNGSANQHRMAAQKQRRTYANYIQRAFEVFAKTAELTGLFETLDKVPTNEVAVTDQPAPIVETPSEVAEHLVARASALDMMVAHILEECCHLPPACGWALPTSCAIERTVEVRSVKGEPLCPGALPAGVAGVKRISGVLAGVPGSGRTSFLYRVAYCWASAWSYRQPLAIYIRAREFLVYIRNRRSVHDFTSRQILANGSRDELESLSKALEEYEQAYGLLWLVDDLDRLPESHQAEVVMQMALSPTVLYATTPWEADRIARQMYQPEVGVFDLAALSKAEQKEMLVALMAQHPEAKADIRLGYLALHEAPYLARLPLGVMAVFDQLLTSIADRVHVAQRALEEYFERARLPNPQFTGEWLTLDPTSRVLIVMATVTGADILWVKEADIFTTRVRFEQGVGWMPDCPWELLARTRLFEPHPKRDDACRFFNWDVLGYLIAQSETARLFAHARIDMTDGITPLAQITLHLKCYAEVWRMESEVLTQLTATNSHPEAERRPVPLTFD